MIILILGDSGGGKSSSMRNMNPKTSIIIQCEDKELPFRGGMKNYSTENKNFKVISQYSSILASAKNMAKEGNKTDIMVVDDSNYLMTKEFMEHASETGYQKFTDMAYNYYTMIQDLKRIVPKEKLVVIMSHINHLEGGAMKPQTIGKLLDEKVNVEGMFSHVVRATQTADGDYKFQVKGNGKDCIKLPMGMVGEKVNFINNDIVELYKIMKEYHF